MMRLVILLMLLPSYAMACTNEAPWYAYGQAKTIPNGSVDNPAANLNGLRGEQSLPFTVPIGRELQISAYGGESYNTGTAQGVVYVPFIGSSPPATNAVFLHSVYASSQSNESVGVSFIIPAGKTINYRLQSSYSIAYVVGWYINGVLCDAP